MCLAWRSKLVASQTDRVHKQAQIAQAITYGFVTGKAHENKAAIIIIIKEAKRWSTADLIIIFVT